MSQNVAAIRRLAISNVPIRGTHNVQIDNWRDGRGLIRTARRSSLARPMGLVPDAFDDEGFAVRNGPSPNLDCSPGVLLSPVVDCRLARSMSAENVACFDVDDLVHGTGPTHT